MIEVPRYIRNYEAVVTAFGYWPSFHDAPVLAFEHTDNAITLALHAWEMTSKAPPTHASCFASLLHLPRLLHASVSSFTEGH